MFSHFEYLKPTLYVCTDSLVTDVKCGSNDVVGYYYS